MIDTLTKIYINWCEKEKIKPDSADSILMCGDITPKQVKWLERFIKIWDKERRKNETRVKKNKSLQMGK